MKLAIAFAMVLMAIHPATAGKSITKDSGPCDLEMFEAFMLLLPRPLDSDFARTTFALLLGTDYASLDRIRDSLYYRFPEQKMALLRSISFCNSMLLCLMDMLLSYKTVTKCYITISVAR